MNTFTERQLAIFNFTGSLAQKDWLLYLISRNIRNGIRNPVSVLNFHYNYRSRCPLVAQRSSFVQVPTKSLQNYFNKCVMRRNLQKSYWLRWCEYLILCAVAVPVGSCWNELLPRKLKLKRNKLDQHVVEGRTYVCASFTVRTYYRTDILNPPRRIFTPLLVFVTIFLAMLYCIRRGRKWDRFSIQLIYIH